MTRKRTRPHAHIKPSDAKALARKAEQRQEHREQEALPPEPTT